MEPEEFPVLKYTVQLYYFPKNKSAPLPGTEYGPVPIASGILIKGVSKYFLLTCKHVFNGIKPDDIIILTSAGFSVRLPEEVAFMKDGDDSIDLALIQFKSYRLRELKSKYSFLPKRNLGLDHVFDDDFFYILFGFANRRTNREDIAFIVESFGYLTNTRSFRKFEKMGFSYDNNITLEYSRKQSDLGDEEDLPKMGFRDLKGLSGGGIWLSVAGKRRDTYRYILVGIMIEERIDRGFIIGTKVSLIEKEINN